MVEMLVDDVFLVVPILLAEEVGRETDAESTFMHNTAQMSR